MVTVGANVKRWRLLRNVTQKELASALGITQAALSQYEIGKREISARMLADIATLLDVPTDALVADKCMVKSDNEIISLYKALSEKQKKIVDSLVLQLSAT